MPSASPGTKYGWVNLMKQCFKMTSSSSSLPSSPENSESLGQNEFRIAGFLFPFAGPEGPEVEKI